MQLKTTHTPVLAVLSLLLASTLWGVYWYPLRQLIGLGLDGPWIVLLVYSGTLLYVPFLLHRRWQELNRSPGLLISIALASGICNTLFILGVLEGNVVRVTLLFFLSPVWATLLAYFFLKEELTLYSYGVLILALAGAMLILWRPEAGIPWPASHADWYGLISGIGFAFSNVCINKADCVAPQVKTAVVWFGAIAVTILILLLRPQPISMPSADAVQHALLVGIIGMGVMTFAVTYGISHLPVHRSAVIMLFEVVVASISSLLLTNERPREIEWLGGILVIIAAYIAIVHQPAHKPPVCDA